MKLFSEHVVEYLGPLYPIISVKIFLKTKIKNRFNNVKMSVDSFKEDMYMAEKHMKSHSTPLIFMEM